ncbi:MAG: nucleotidyltransferase domain-containing protein [Deltaproteobacteria bacterium]|nr:nucleotidyltransferase domain-containing protein [Deltaproteobacteria bacterium]
MADEKGPVIETIKLYIKELAKNQIPISRAILFGSHAKGIARPESDIDIALISEAFTGDRFEDRRRIVPLRRNIDSRIEPIPFKPEDFNDGGILAEEIKEIGVAIL